jgi:hypothetical protein
LPNTINLLKTLLFFKKIPIKKALQQKAKGLEVVWLPLLVSFRTFEADMIIEIIRLKQLILQY